MTARSCCARWGWSASEPSRKATRHAVGDFASTCGKAAQHRLATRRPASACGKATRPQLATPSSACDETARVSLRREIGGFARSGTAFRHVPACALTLPASIPQGYRVLQNRPAARAGRRGGPVEMPALPAVARDVVLLDDELGRLATASAAIHACVSAHRTSSSKAKRLRGYGIRAGSHGIGGIRRLPTGEPPSSRPSCPWCAPDGPRRR